MYRSIFLHGGRGRVNPFTGGKMYLGGVGGRQNVGARGTRNVPFGRGATGPLARGARR